MNRDMRRGIRPPPVVLLAVAVLAVPATVAAAAVPSPRIVSVGTSRGDRDLLVYAPDAPRAGPGPTASTPFGPFPVPQAGRPLVLLISGEGGWRRFDRLLADWLADAGYCVGGVSAMDYFWEAQDDRQVLASDFRAFAAALASAAGRPADAPLVFAGFSFGADLAPWLAGAGGWGRRVRGLLMIGPDRTGSLAFRLSEILGLQQKDHLFSVADALRSAAGLPAVFVHGGKDADSDAPSLAESADEPKRIIAIPGADHHFSGHEKELRDAVLTGLEWIGAAVPARSGP